MGHCEHSKLPSLGWATQDRLGRLLRGVPKGEFAARNYYDVWFPTLSPTPETLKLELQAAKDWGKPLDFGDGYDQTPAELRMPFKVLKDAGGVPHEVELLRRVAALREQLEAAPDAPHAPALRRQLMELQQAIALRLEHLRLTGSL